MFWRFSNQIKRHFVQSEIECHFFFIFPLSDVVLWFIRILSLPSSTLASRKGGNWRRREAESQLKQEMEFAFLGKHEQSESLIRQSGTDFLFPALEGRQAGWMRREGCVQFPPPLRAESLNTCDFGIDFSWKFCESLAFWSVIGNE